MWKTFQLVSTALFFSLSGIVADYARAETNVSVYNIDPEHSSIRWKVNAVPHNHYTGEFLKYDATLHIDPSQPETAKLLVSIDPSSIRTDFLFADRFDKELSFAPTFFNASQFPDIKFASTSLEQTDETVAELSGDLIMLGFSKPVALTVRFLGQNDSTYDTLEFSAEGTLFRSDFGIVSRKYVADSILVLIDARFTKAKSE